MRDQHALESCCYQPQMCLFGQDRFESIHDKAAAYCWFIARNHPFTDGNKRTALAAAFVFYAVNGIIPCLDSDATYELIIRVAAGDCELEELARAFRATTSRPD